MKKLKTLCIVLAMCMLSGVLPNTAFAAYPDVNADDGFYQSVERLKELGIISGYDDGLFHAERDVTRAEFAKIIVCVAGVEKDAKSYATASTFYDVPQGHWAISYISYVTAKKIVAGYPDGSFGPSKTITYAEALTIIGKLLGYTEETVGYYWPTNYVEAASNAGITAGLEFNPYDSINRGTAAIMIDRALFADMSKTSASANGKTGSLLESMGYKVIEDCYVISSKNEDESLMQNQMRTSDGIYEVTDTALFANVGKVGTAIVNPDGKIKQFSPSDMISQTVVVNSVNGNTVEYTASDSSKGSFRFENTFVTYLDYAKSTYAMTSSSIKTGTELTFYGKSNGNWSFVVIDAEDKTTPILASHDYSESDNYMENTPINHVNLTVYRNGKAATLADIEKNDVVYYNTRINTMDVYTKKVTGIYYDAIPSKAYVTEVTVGGKNYKIGSTSATNRLNASNGSFEIGDELTLLLGKDDEVVFAVELTDFDYFDYGVLVSSGQKIAESGENEGISETYVKIYMPDGETYEYVSDKKYSDYIGKLVSVKYNNSKVSLSLVNTTSKTYGEIDYKNRTIGGKSVLKDVKIIQRISTEDDKNVQLENLSFDTLETSELAEYNVIASVSTNKFGDVGILYVTGLAGSVSYGVLKSRTDVEPYSYTIYTDSTNTYSSEGKYSVGEGLGVSFKKNSSGQISDVKAMYQMKKSSDIGAIDANRIMIDGEIFKIHSQVVVVDITDYNNYKTTTIDEIAKMKNISNVAVYSDKSATNGGLVKVITVRTK